MLAVTGALAHPNENRVLQPAVAGTTVAVDVTLAAVGVLVATAGLACPTHAAWVSPKIKPIRINL